MPKAELHINDTKFIIFTDGVPPQVNFLNLPMLL